MNSLHSLAQEFQIPHSFLESYKTYVGITSKQMDKVVAASAVDVFATQAYSQNADNKIYNDLDTAYAVAVVTYILIEQPIEVIIKLSQLNPQPTEHQKYGIELLKYIMFQLDKQDPLVYLNTLMANKNIPNQPIQQGVEFSKIYSFVHLCGFAQLLKPLQTEMPITHLLGAQQITAFDSHSVDSSLPVLYQLAKSSPILVILKPDQVDIQKTVFYNHMKFMKDICIQLTLDATTQSLSIISQSLLNQPYKFQKIEDLAGLIFAGQPNFDDRRAKFLKIPNIQKTLGFLVNPSFNIQEAKQQLQDQQETTVVQELTNNSPQQPQASFDPFKTQIQSNTTQQQAIRKTMHY